MEGSIYILQFQSEGEMEDIVIFTDKEIAFQRLKLKWESRNLLEYGFANGVGYGLKCIYYADEKGSITEYKCKN